MYKQFKFESFDEDKYIPKDIYNIYTEKKDNSKEYNTKEYKSKYTKIKDKYSNLNDMDKEEEQRRLSKHIANKKENKG